MMKKLLSAILLAIVLAEATLTLPAYAADLVNGAKIFNANCSACHIGGNNVIIANKTLKKEALEKYGMNSLDAVKTQVSKGKNAMPAFVGRLSESQIEDVASYILEQSQKGW
ncbi:cytochrome c6 PetJ [Pantanalinema rosaneae CENA516]|uniref:cytochrome c6 PetJ n=1 Tax=Pantanalinema rosaneae TaxID=1620701 RepID=UPI003D700D10